MKLFLKIKFCKQVAIFMVYVLDIQILYVIIGNGLNYFII